MGGQNKMKKYVYVVTGAGMDWHDFKLYTEYLMEKGKYEITDPESVITAFIKKQRDESADYAREIGDEVTTFASDEEIREAVRTKSTLLLFAVNKETFHREHPTYYARELTLSYDAEKDDLKIEADYFGWFIATMYIHTDVFEDETAIRYIAAENFLCPVKGEPSWQRFYHEPFADFDEFKAYFDEMKLHEESRNVWADSVCEMLVIDINECEKESSECFTWFRKNMDCIHLLEQMKGKINEDDAFRMSVNAHYEELKKRLAEMQGESGETPNI
jgi:hypothetical protein